MSGATPDKWARRYRERERSGLDLVPIEEADQESGVRDGSLDMALARRGVTRVDLGQVDTDTQPGLARFKLGAGADCRSLGGTWANWL